MMKVWILALALLGLSPGLVAAQWIEEQQLLASDGAPEDIFGSAVSIAGDVIVVGVPEDEDRLDNTGSAWVFERIGGTWQATAKLTATGAESGDQFGWSVVTDGELIAVGGPVPEARFPERPGSVWVFRKVAGAWTEMQRLQASDAAEFDYFGHSLALDEGTLAVGAIGSTPGGAVYLFRETGGAWEEVQKLSIGDGVPGDWFGHSVAIRGDRMLVGAQLESTADNDSGSAYVFERTGNLWQQVAELQPHDSARNDKFGSSVAIVSESVLAVGASHHDHGVSSAGAAYIFELDPQGGWSETQEILADDRMTLDYFGISMACSGGDLLIGAPYWQIDETWGCAYVFRQQDGAWQQVGQLLAHGLERFGSPVAASGGDAVIGAPRFSSGVGAAYVYAQSTPCLPDWNGDGRVDTLDFLAYLNDWAAREPGADLNDDGVVDTQDFLVFLNAWAAGC